MTACKNCNTSLTLETDYCYNCGAKVIRNRLTIKNLFEDFSQTYLNFDNTFIKTFISLFTKPEEVIGCYIDGTRKKYVNVISYFALAITVSGLYLVIVKKFFPEALDYSSLNFDPQQAEFQKKNMTFIEEYQSLLMMLYVPIYAIMARVSFAGIKKYNYTELLVIFLYVQAQISFVSAVLGVILSAAGMNQGEMILLLIPLMILYAAFCLKRLYNLNFLNIFLRTLLFFAVLVVMLMVMSVIMAIVMFLNGDFQEMIEAKKAASGA
jgi:hypothetical protein